MFSPFLFILLTSFYSQISFIFSLKIPKEYPRDISADISHDDLYLLNAPEISEKEENVLSPADEDVRSEVQEEHLVAEEDEYDRPEVQEEHLGPEEDEYDRPEVQDEHLGPEEDEYDRPEVQEDLLGPKDDEYDRPEVQEEHFGPEEDEYDRPEVQEEHFGPENMTDLKPEVQEEHLGSEEEEYEPLEVDEKYIFLYTEEQVKKTENNDIIEEKNFQYRDYNVPDCNMDEKFFYDEEDEDDDEDNIEEDIEEEEENKYASYRNQRSKMFHERASESSRDGSQRNTSKEYESVIWKRDINKRKAYFVEEDAN
ncbi:hypothetical protein HZS_4032, partial [Henneguya salminicola]